MTGRTLALAAVVLAGSILSLRSEARAQGEDRYELTRRAFALGLRTSGVYDSNIDHDEADIDSQGVIAGLEARLQSGGRRPLFRLRYQGTLRRFARTERWNRLEHDIGGVVAGKSGPLTIELRGEVDFKGATEDRELGNQYTLSPRTTLDVGPARLRAYGAARIRTISETSLEIDPEQPASTRRNDLIVYVGAELRWKTGDGSDWTVEYRYENSHSSSSSQDYKQQRISAEYENELTDRNEVALGIEYRPRRFSDRLVEVERLDEDGEPVIVEEQRADDRWIPFISLTQIFPWGPELELEYEYQHRNSNDPDKVFEAHRLTLTLRLPLVSRYRRTRIDD